MLVTKISAFVLTIFFWQHLGRVYDVTLRPSYFLTQVAIFCEFCWTKLGNLIAYLGSYYHYLVFYSKELVVSMLELMAAGYRCLASYLYFFSGFWEMAMLYAEPKLIVFGSILLGLVVIGLMLWYFKIDIWCWVGSLGQTPSTTQTPPTSPDNIKPRRLKIRHQKNLNHSFPMDDDGNIVTDME